MATTTDLSGSATAPRSAPVGAAAPASPTRPRTSRLHRREHRAAALFVAAPVIGFSIFTIFPFLFSLYVSMTSWNGLGSLGNMRFVGLDNFTAMFSDPYFFQTLYNTFFMMLGIPVGLLLALVLAMALNRGMRGTMFFRTVYYVPVISSLAAIAILWQWAYNGDFGLVNQALGYVGIDGPNWLQDKDTVKPAIMIMAIWKGLGFSMLLYLAALQSVPRSLYEAASLDGANALQKFRSITLPLVSPVTFFLTVTSIIAGSQIFTEIDIMTPTGGPEMSSATIVWYVWQKAFRNLQMGYASAMSLTLAVIILVLTVISFRINARKSFEMD